MTDDYDPHRYNPNVHYRLFMAKRNGKPVVICLQDFDYLDFTDGEFLSPDAWDDEADAERALDEWKAIRMREAMETLRWLT